MSQHLNSFGIKGVIKIGNIYIPGDDKFPSFEEYFKKNHAQNSIDRMLDHLQKSDLDGLKLLLPLLVFVPKFILKLLLISADKHSLLPSFISPPFRMINFGLKGLILTLYYSDLDGVGFERGKVLSAMDWNPKMENNKDISMHTHSPQEVFKIAKLANEEISSLSLKQRVQFISQLKKVILEKKDYIIERIQTETRKTKLDALASEIFPLLDHLEFLENNAAKYLQDQKIKTPLAMMGKKSQVVYDSLGTILVISPWNYPFYQALTPISTSFVCGNATVYKPSEFTPLKGLVEEILQLSGFKNEWAQVVYGDGKVGASLIEQRPDKIFFTGSVRTGEIIMREASKGLIPVELELGGKDPMIVFEDANLERAVAGAMWGAFTNTGQSCTSVENLFVHESIYDSFVQLLKSKLKGLKIGVDKGNDFCDIGEMTTPAQVAIVKDQLEELKNKNVSITSNQVSPGNQVIHPTIIEGELTHLKVFNEETFGPLLPITKFKSESEVIALANQSQYGLSASVWGKDKERCLRVARALKTGNVSINNVMLTEGNHHLPFGGVKKSGFGRYKGRWGLESFSNIKSILIDSNSSKIEANWYPYTAKKYHLFSQMMVNLFKCGPMAFIKFAFYGIQLESEAAKSWKQLEEKSK